MAKGPEAFRTISEASRELGVAQHVLRFWETRFSFVRPMKRAGGRRFYRPRDIAVLATLKQRLYKDGLSIKDVQALYRQGGFSASGSSRHAPAAASSEDQTARLEAALARLETAHGRLASLLSARLAQ